MCLFVLLCFPRGKRRLAAPYISLFHLRCLLGIPGYENMRIRGKGQTGLVGVFSI